MKLSKEAVILICCGVITLHAATSTSRAEGLDGQSSDVSGTGGEGGAGALSRTPVVTLNGSTLPYEMDGDIKVFHLVAEAVRQELAPGVTINAWGYNGSTPGPTIEAVEGDRVRILVTNRLPEATSIHWHGVFVPSGMDGVSGLSQSAIGPGMTYVYEFRLRQHGTFMYHPHVDEMTQMAMGMMGFFIIHPADASVRRVDRDFAIFLQEWALKPGTETPDPAEMLDFNYFSFNGKVWPATAPLVVREGEKVRIRLANLSMDNHPIHIHGFAFRITGTSGGPIPESAQWPATTVDVAAGQTRDVEFLADEPGDWAFHCHKTHHVMVGMEHGLPNVIGMDSTGADEKIRRLLPSYMTMGQAGMGHAMEGPTGIPNYIGMGGAEGPHGRIDMSGMFTIIKVRGDITSYEDPGWYVNPPGTEAQAMGESPGPAGAEPVYTCPMHPQIRVRDAGRCPICGMNLVRAEETPASQPAAQEGREKMSGHEH